MAKKNDKKQHDARSSRQPKTIKKADLPELWKSIYELIEIAICIEDDDFEKQLLQGQSKFAKVTVEAKKEAEIHLNEYIRKVAMVVISDRAADVYEDFKEGRITVKEKSLKLTDLICRSPKHYLSNISSDLKQEILASLADKNDSEATNFDHRGPKVNARRRFGKIFGKKGKSSTLSEFKSNNLVPYGYDTSNLNIRQSQANPMHKFYQKVCENIFSLSPKDAQALASVILSKSLDSI